MDEIINFRLNSVEQMAEQILLDVKCIRSYYAGLESVLKSNFNKNNQANLIQTQEVDNEKTLGEKIKELRIQKMYSQGEISKELGVSRAMISYIENDDKMPSVAMLKRLAKLFEVSLDYLVNEEN